jgi:LacI family transcriptional regulator
VRSDHRAGISDAVEHLLDQGHRRITLVSGSPVGWAARERATGIAEALAARRLARKTVSIVHAARGADAEDLVGQLIQARPGPTAILTAGTAVLGGCLRALARRRVRLPEDLSLVACDETLLSELYAPPISAVGRDARALGRTAAELLVERLVGSSAPRTVLLPTTFTPRASSGPAPGE